MTAPPNVLIIAVDCLAWVLFESEFAAGNLPTLSELVERGVLFRQAITANTYTTPAFASLLTGLYSPRHGVQSLRGKRLNPDAPDFVAHLQKYGYHTEAWVTGPLHPALGLSRSWDEYDYRDHTDYLLGRDHRHIDWLRAHAGTGPWFALLHLWEMHHPRQVLTGVPARGALEPLYRRSLRSVDVLIGRLAGALDLDRTLIVVLGDHGENISWVDYPSRLGKTVHTLRVLARRRPLRFLRNSHGMHVYEDLIRIPWIMSGATLAPGVADHPVSLIDVMPTITGAIGLPFPQESGKTDGMNVLTGSDSERVLGVFSRPLRKWPRIDCARRSPWKLVKIQDRRTGRTIHSLYNFAEDPLERTDFKARQPDVFDMLSHELDVLSAPAQ